MNTNFDIDMSKELTIKNNLKKSKIITIGSCALGALLFLIAYAVNQNIWFIAATIVLVIAGIFFLVVVSAFEKKYSHVIDPDKYKEEK